MESRACARKREQLIFLGLIMLGYLMLLLVKQKHSMTGHKPYGLMANSSSRPTNIVKPNQLLFKKALKQSALLR